LGRKLVWLGSLLVQDNSASAGANAYPHILSTVLVLGCQALGGFGWLFALFVWEEARLFWSHPSSRLDPRVQKWHDSWTWTPTPCWSQSSIPWGHFCAEDERGSSREIQDEPRALFFGTYSFFLCFFFFGLQIQKFFSHILAPKEVKIMVLVY
jgi:hypothetical protein